MAHIILTDGGKFYKRNPDSSTFTEISLPTGVAQTSPVVRPSFASYRKRTYIAGQFDSNLLWTEFGTLRKMGIAATSTAPTATVGSSTGITATNVIYYYTMAEKSGTTVIHESDLSSGSTAIPALSNQSVDISGLPTTGPARVTHKRLYRKDNGGATRHVADIALATSTYTDTTATLSLGDLAPTNHGEPGYFKYFETYHERLWGAGDTDNPSYVWYSEIGKPEAYGDLSYIPTLDGETVTGLKRCGDQLIVFCAQATYAIQGFNQADFEIVKLDPSIGCISHHSIVNIQETLWFASEIGVYTYNGAFRYMMEDLRDYWRDDYASNVSTYQDSNAIDDRYYNGYCLLIPKSAAFYYFGHYLPVWNGEQPYWVFDARTRADKTVGVLAPLSASRYDQYVGSTDGYLRKMNVTANADDDSDSLAKQLIIQTGALLMGDPGGNIEQGKTFTKLWTYVESESNAWTLYAVGGDEDLVNAATPDNSTKFWKDDVAASASSGKTKQSVHYHKPDRVSGRALGLKIVANSPSSMKYRGFGGVYGPGPAGRPTTS
jgi:hypothetical protein